VSGRGESRCTREVIGAPSMFRLIRRTLTLARMLPTLALSWK
jgi:hypothetical protein